MRLWIDTDVGDDPDDVVALVCADAHPDVEVVGVSVVGGRELERADLARRYVDSPVYVADGALAGRFRAARPEALLAIGPLTNVRVLLDALPATPLTLMGGVVVPVRHRGEVRRVEHNVGSDPTAAAAVFARGGAVVVPLDVTVAMAVGPPDHERLRAAIPGLDAEVARWRSWASRTTGVPSDDIVLVLHDPLALLVCTHDADAAIAVERRALSVDVSGALVDGGRVQDVVTTVDGTRAMARVLELVES